MIPQRNTIKKDIQKQCVVQHLKVRRELEFDNLKFYGGGEGGLREEENEKNIFWGFTHLGRYSLGRGSQIGRPFKF